MRLEDQRRRDDQRRREEQDRAEQAQREREQERERGGLHDIRAAGNMAEGAAHRLLDRGGSSMDLPASSARTYSYADAAHRMPHSYSHQTHPTRSTLERLERRGFRQSDAIDALIQTQYDYDGALAILESAEVAAHDARERDHAIREVERFEQHEAARREEAERHQRLLALIELEKGGYSRRDAELALHQANGDVVTARRMLDASRSYEPHEPGVLQALGDTFTGGVGAASSLVEGGLSAVGSLLTSGAASSQESPAPADVSDGQNQKKDAAYAQRLQKQYNVEHRGQVAIDKHVARTRTPR